jgi:hypothetical protein
MFNAALGFGSAGPLRQYCTAATHDDRHQNFNCLTPNPQSMTLWFKYYFLKMTNAGDLSSLWPRQVRNNS